MAVRWGAPVQAIDAEAGAAGRPVRVRSLQEHAAALTLGGA